jgi:hypothetical protein
MAIVTALDKFRLELGDRNTDAQLFNDVEAQYFIDKHPTNLLLAVADACDALAAQYAREFDFDANESKSFKRSQKAQAYLEMGRRLRVRALVEGETDGTGGVPIFLFPAPYDWVNDLHGPVTDSVDEWGTA